MVEERRLLLEGLLGQFKDDLVGVAYVAFMVVVDEVAPKAVRAESRGVVGLAQVTLVLRMSDQRPQLVPSMRKLALLGVLAAAILLKRPTQLRLVTTFSVLPLPRSSSSLFILHLNSFLACFVVFLHQFQAEVSGVGGAVVEGRKFSWCKVFS